MMIAGNIFVFGANEKALLSFLPLPSFLFFSPPSLPPLEPLISGAGERKEKKERQEEASSIFSVLFPFSLSPPLFSALDFWTSLPSFPFGRPEPSLFLLIQPPSLPPSSFYLPTRPFVRSRPPDHIGSHPRHRGQKKGGHEVIS